MSSAVSLGMTVKPRPMAGGSAVMLSDRQTVRLVREIVVLSMQGRLDPSDAISLVTLAVDPGPMDEDEVIARVRQRLAASTDPPTPTRQ
jgi:hypothetical protein